MPKFGTIRSIMQSSALEHMCYIYANSRCPCGCGGSWDKTVSGTIGSKRAIWMGCAGQNGSAVGCGFSGEMCGEIRNLIGECDLIGESPQDAVEARIKLDALPDYERSAILRDAETLEEINAAIEDYCDRMAARRQKRRDEEQNENEEWERERPQRDARSAKHAAEVEKRQAEYGPLLTQALEKCRVKANGKRHRGDEQTVLRAYDGACIGYDSDRAHWLRTLTLLATFGPPRDENEQ